MAKFNYYVGMDAYPPTTIVARYRPLDLTCLPNSRNVGLLWVGENRGVWLVLRSHAWLIGTLPPTVYQFSRRKVVLWAKAKLEEWHRTQQEKGWPGESGRVYRAWKEEVVHA
jgi:hypothetical protein